jgi:osmotically-inducible protein OsmY
MSLGGTDLEYLVSEALLITDNICQAVFEVENADGIITLKGAVGSMQDRLTAEALARRQEGVVEVINNLWVPDF